MLNTIGAQGSITEDSPIDKVVLARLREFEDQDAPHFVAELIDSFLADTPPKLDTLQMSINNGDGVALARAAHNLKGSTGSLGAIRMMALCRELEDTAKQDSLALASEILAKLQSEFLLVAEALKIERDSGLA